MGLLNPDSGLVFWVSLSFFIVFFILAKFGFPIIIRSLEERKRFIDSSIRLAEHREKQLADVEQDAQAIIERAEKERSEILREASQLKEEILSDARQRALAEAARITESARIAADEERKAILRDAKNQVATMAIELSERVLRNQLKEREKQIELAQKMIKEIEPHFNNEA